MNKRLKELAKQAGATLEKGYIELSDGQLMLSDNVDLDKSNMDLEKFAELIVRECADYITESAFVETLLGKKLLERFGVE